MFRRGLPIILLFVIILMLLSILPVQGGSSLDSPQQTWPSRTPTSNAPPNPTQPPPGGGTSAPPSPEGSPPAASATESIPVTQPPLAADNLLPTAEPCQVPPTAMALGTVAVRSGPGIAYDQIGNLTFSEVRIIVGRTQYLPWWQIKFAGDQTGWVSAEAVDVQGYTANVPIVSPPLLDNTTPEPGPEWMPTADPICFMTVNAADASPSPIPVTQEPIETTETKMSQSVISEAPEASAGTPSPTEIITEVPKEQTTSEVLEQPNLVQEGSTGSGSNPNWILGLGLLFIVGAAAIYLIQRRSR
jgi:LPXTG-motif cell wall-anchored protein